jgi:glutamate--cysteine ligase
VGLLYDDAALDACFDIIKGWTAEQRQQLREDVPAQGLQASIAGRTLQDIALETLEISRETLNKRAHLNGHGENETVFLQALDAMARSGQSNADRLIGAFKGSWDGDVSHAYTECIY